MICKLINIIKCKFKRKECRCKDCNWLDKENCLIKNDFNPYHFDGLAFCRCPANNKDNGFLIIEGIKNKNKQAAVAYTEDFLIIDVTTMRCENFKKRR